MLPVWQPNGMKIFLVLADAQFLRAYLLCGLIGQRDAPPRVQQDRPESKRIQSSVQTITHSNLAPRNRNAQRFASPKRTTRRLRFSYRIGRPLAFALGRSPSAIESEFFGFVIGLSSPVRMKSVHSACEWSKPLGKESLQAVLSHRELPRYSFAAMAEL